MSYSMRRSYFKSLTKFLRVFKYKTSDFHFQLYSKTSFVVTFPNVVTHRNRNSPRLARNVALLEQVFHYQSHIPARLQPEHRKRKKKSKTQLQQHIVVEESSYTSEEKSPARIHQHKHSTSKSGVGSIAVYSRRDRSRLRHAQLVLRDRLVRRTESFF